jgi:hypothetical protein
MATVLINALAIVGQKVVNNKFDGKKRIGPCPKVAVTVNPETIIKPSVYQLKQIEFRVASYLRTVN